MADDNKTSRVVLVTGASGGIGKSIVRKLLSDGWRVYGAARRVEKMRDIQSEGAKTLSLDVTDDESMKKAVQALISSEGRIDALVNNAGYGSYGAVEDVPISEARRQFEVNVFGLARLSQLVLPTMREQRSGTIVNISSIGGGLPSQGIGLYRAMKSYGNAVATSLYRELRRTSVHLSSVRSRAAHTPFLNPVAAELKLFGIPFSRLAIRPETVGVGNDQVDRAAEEGYLLAARSEGGSLD